MIKVIPYDVPSPDACPEGIGGRGRIEHFASAVQGLGPGDAGYRLAVNLGEHGHMPMLAVASTTRNVPGGFVAASALGVLHAAFSLYWAAGWTLLVWSLGSDLVESFRGREWLLAPIGLVKMIAAVGPLVCARSGRPAGRVTRSACWLGALLLMIWGGLNTAVGNLVLAGVIRPESGFDQPGMIGHAYLWDPLFLAWGAALAIGPIVHAKERPMPR